MLLFDLLYPDRSGDSAIPLPGPEEVPVGTRAASVDGPRQRLVSTGAEWVDGCTADDRCPRRAYAKGLCEPHYLQARRATERGEAPSFRPVRSADDPTRVVLSMRVSPVAKERAADDPDGVRDAVEAWARSR